MSGWQKSEWLLSMGGKCLGGICPWVAYVNVAYVYGWQMSLGGICQGETCPGGKSSGVAKIKLANVFRSHMLGVLCLGG